MTTPPADAMRPEGDETTGSAPVVTLGLVPSPGLPEEVARDIVEDLTAELPERVDSSVAWVVRVVPDPLTGTDVASSDLFGELVNVAKQEDWDYAIALTDIPSRNHKRIELANASVVDEVGWISIPALGPFRIRPRTRQLIMELVRSFRLERSEGAEDIISSTIARRDNPTGRTDAEETTYIAPGLLARLRLLGGMVYSNQPWTTFASFKTTVATAVATASYGLIFTSLWEFGSVYSVWRQVSLMLLAMGLLAIWIIISHRLWQPQLGVSAQFVTSMYNATTVVTVTCGVVFAYVLIYVILLVEAAVFMPPSHLESRLQLPPEPLTYAKTAWVAASIGTLAGAIGAGLENTEAVRRATFGWRQRRRYEEHQEQTRRERDADRRGTSDSP